MKAPVVTPPWAKQLVVGAAAVPQQVPRAVRVAPPLEVTLAPRVAVEDVTEDTVGEVTVGATTAAVVKDVTAPNPVPTELLAIAQK